jgi:anti-anti-sigma factor
MKLSLVSIEKNGLVRVTCEGKVTADDIPADGHNPFHALLGDNWATQRVMLDFTCTPYIDSSAIGWLISSNKQFKAKGGSFVIYAIPPSIRRLFDLLKFGKVVTLADDQAAARCALEGEVVS